LSTEIGGFVAPGLEPVRDAFERNFTERGELGAAFSVHRQGQTIVDLWGGVADRRSGRAWEAGTLAVIFSGSKGLVATCLLLLIDRGELELDAAVSRYWPEFAVHGKEALLVRDLVSHTARLPGVTRAASIAEFADDRHMTALLEREPACTDPRAALCYHGFTFGWLCGELVRRIDGRTVGRFFADEIAEPLELELWIGLPEELEPRVATLELADAWPQSEHLRTGTLARDELLRSIWGNPPVLDRDSFPWNDARYHRAEIPGAGGIGTARSVAKLYGSLESLIAPRTLLLGRTTASEGYDVAHAADQRFGVGFQLQTQTMGFGPEPSAFGHGGAGGSVHGAWPAHGLGFSYTMNELRDSLPVDPRGQELLTALHRVVDA
jgi:CubicO group peptidase (beta-lactamase class C family)